MRRREQHQLFVDGIYGVQKRYPVARVFTYHGCEHCIESKATEIAFRHGVYEPLVLLVHN